VTDRPLDIVIAENLTAVRARLARAAAASGRPPEDIRLIAVSKTFGPDAVRAAIAAGQRDFGENKVQEALPKIDAVAAGPRLDGAADAAVADSLRWHLIGHLQSNKARKAARPFDAIHSIDSIDLLQKVDAAALEAHRRPDLLLQVDLAGEETKFGAPEQAVRDILAAGRDLAAARIVGLMTLPPFYDDADAARPHFRRLRQLRDTLIDDGVPPEMLRELSMGMSHDFEVAVAEGATMVRVGTAIFGLRPKPAPAAPQKP
jgi:pyridoxal phosphate enzyme (YggS family)